MSPRKDPPFIFQDYTVQVVGKLPHLDDRRLLQLPSAVQKNDKESYRDGTAVKERKDSKEAKEGAYRTRDSSQTNIVLPWITSCIS